MLPSLTTDAEGQDFLAAAFGDCNASWGTEALADSAGAEIRIGRRRGRGRRLRVPVYVEDAASIRSLEGQLRYDPADLRPLGARLVDRTAPALLEWNVPVDGQLKFALASSEPIAGGRRPILVVQFLVRSRKAESPSIHSLGLKADDVPSTEGRAEMPGL